MMDWNLILENNFSRGPSETVLFLYDTPTKDDNEQWRRRRELVKIWQPTVKNSKIASFEATYANNADIPDIGFEGYDIVIALTEFSATAPLHKFARKHNFRGASMPGFTEEMIPALEVDFDEVARKVQKIYDLFKQGEYVKIEFNANGVPLDLKLDIRFRSPRKDDGFCTQPGNIINLPSGEAFIVPYEDEKAAKSRSKGFLPLQTDKIRIYEVSGNKIVNCSDPNCSLMDRIKKDPAVGNIAEMAFGVLKGKSTGRVLLDEKLGMHIALGRSEHLGGKTSPQSFKYQENVWHQDYVFIKDVQPGIDIIRASIQTKDDEITIIEKNKFRIF